MSQVKAVTDYATVKTMDKTEAQKADLYEVIGGAIDDAYMEELKKQVKNPEIIKEVQKDLTIVYTPLHGTGNIPARRVLKELGFENVYVVPQQELPDGEFRWIWQRKKMQIWYWLQTRMQTVLVCM